MFHKRSSHRTEQSGGHAAVPAGAGRNPDVQGWERLLRGRWHAHRGLAVLCVMGVAAFLLMLMTVFGEQGIFRVRRLERDRVMLEEKIATAEKESAELRRRIQALKSGPAPYEKAAREQLGLVRPGEVVYDFRTDPLIAAQR